MTHKELNQDLKSINLMDYDKIECKQDLLMNTLTSFFKNNINVKQLLPIINGQSDISLRVLDWFITNYSKKNFVSYKVKKKEIQFRVHKDYKSQLKAYSKKQFDPFCRRDRILFYYDNTEYIVTTVGQLNFFRWAIENEIIEYIECNLNEIEKDMIISIKDIDITTKKKRRHSPATTTKIINKDKASTVISFD
jgi:hypothetical protein